MTIDQLNKLTDEEVRVRVAERLGFNFFFYQIILCWPNPESGNCWSSGIHPTRESAQLAADELIASGRVLKEIKEHRHEVPNYPTDLNAMHEAEKMLKEGQLTKYFIELYDVCDGASVMATARQRALAFLAVTEREEG